MLLFEHCTQCMKKVLTLLKHMRAKSISVLLLIVLLFSIIPSVHASQESTVDQFGTGFNEVVIADRTDGLDEPRDLEFHPNPTRSDELWIVNRADDAMVIIHETGTSSQTVIPITRDVATTKASGFSLVEQGSPKVIQITDSDVDAVSIQITVPQLQKFSDEGDIFGTSIELQIAVQYSGGGYQTVVSGNDGTIAGRTPDAYVRDYLVNLSGAFPVNIKVTRVTANSSSSKLVDAFQFNNYVEIKYDKRSYPNSALVGLKVDAEQFSSIPSRKYLVNGIKVKIPHNATVRADGSLEYTGTFNGTLGAAHFTNDPAWCLYDLLSSERYGLGSHLSCLLYTSDAADEE